ncbi:MAG: S26 family signal peptidase [Brevundimonas sp.]|nr:MAG: S26 family signal peptidase [Brevundimonas sp.]
MNPRTPLFRRWAGPAVALLALGALGLLARHAPAPALVNESRSLPRGLYLRAPGATPRRGAVVAVPQPGPARAYLGGLGVPADLPLIKRVAAVGGDTVCREGGVVRVQTRRATVMVRDRRGDMLPVWMDCRRLEPGELFLLGDTPGSFDSRYFGPVRVSDVDGVFREFLTW